MAGTVLLIVMCWGVGVFFAVQALRTPWRPPRTEATEVRYLGRSSRPWGRARFLVFSVGLALVGVYVLLIGFELI
jgi:hypothetical protein